MSQSVTVFFCAALLLGYAGRAGGAAVTVLAAVAAPDAPPLPSAMSPHCASSAFLSLTSSLATPTDVLHCAGSTSPKSFRSSTYGSVGSSSFATLTRTRSASIWNDASSGLTFFANTSKVTCERDWYHWCLYRGAGGSAGACGAADAGGISTRGFLGFGASAARSSFGTADSIATKIRSSHFLIHSPYTLAPEPSSCAPLSKHILAASASPSSKNAMPLRR